MGVLNRQPDLGRIVKELEDRVRHLERTRRLTVTTVKDYTEAPAVAQSGDLMVDASTGMLFVYMITGSTTTTSAVTYSIPYPAFPVAEVKGFKRGGLVAITLAGVEYEWQVYTINGLNTPTNAHGPGNLGGTFLNNSGIGIPYPLPPNGTVFPAGTALVARSWRQLITASQMYRWGLRGQFQFAGAGAYPGDTEGGVGEVLGRGYPPPSAYFE